MLEDTAHQHLLVTGETVFGAIAMVHVEVDDRDTLQAMSLDGVTGGNTDVVEEAEAHRGRFFAMVAGRTHGTEGVLDFFPHDEVDRQATGAGGPQGSLPGMRIHGGIRIEMDDAMLGRSTLDALEVRCRMDAQQLFEGCQRGIVINKIGIDPLRNQVIIDGRQTLRAFRVMRPHVVQLAVAMGNESSGCHFVVLFRLFVSSNRPPPKAHVEIPLWSQSLRRFKH